MTGKEYVKRVVRAASLQDVEISKADYVAALEEIIIIFTDDLEAADVELSIENDE